MREQADETVVCLCCGARSEGDAPAPPAPAVTWHEERRRLESFARDASPAPRRRSGLAYAAGYSGLACFFLAFALGPPAGWGLGFTILGPYGVPRFIPLWTLWAPVTLALAFAAARSLDRSQGEEEGALPALVGFLVGLCGTGMLALHALVPGGLMSLP